MSGFEITMGAALVVVALGFQFLIWKRVKDPKTRKVYAWIAWSFAYIGGVSLATDISAKTGITVAGAFMASALMIGFIVNDLRDKRPDWAAFILIILAPAFMQMVGGPVGAFYDLLLLPGSFLASNAATLVGA